ncbi:hypothetical protein [Clostridium lundense]|uniref:hypothetical protein n=1 Tax=Clostridium lundense TaxID=319475 RepID=UPI000687C077|nr:hypothetical protein [Clostridium lundense]
MKKSLIVTALILVSIISLYFYKIHKQNPTSIHLNENYIEEISIAKLPSPPKKKVLSEKKDIKKIVDFINSIKLIKKIDQPFKGWVYLIKISGKNDYDISFLKDKISINGTWYEVDSNIINNLDDLYKELDYK